MVWEAQRNVRIERLAQSSHVHAPVVTIKSLILCCRNRIRSPGAEFREQPHVAGNVIVAADLLQNCLIMLVDQLIHWIKSEFAFRSLTTKLTGWWKQAQRSCSQSGAAPCSAAVTLLWLCRFTFSLSQLP